MLYAERDENGTITAIKNSPSTPDEKPVSDDELIDFFSAAGDTASYETLLAVLDNRVIRVLDDLIEVLVKKNVIMFTDLPEEARKKIGQRQRVRQRLQEDNQLMVDDII